MIRLTDRDRAVLRVVVDRRPTGKELCRILGYRSRGTALEAMSRLCRGGWLAKLQKPRCRGRVYEPTARALEALGAS